VLKYLGQIYKISPEKVSEVIIANIRLPNLLEIIQQVRSSLFRKYPNWFTLDKEKRLSLARKTFARLVGFHSVKFAQRTSFAAQRLIKTLQKEHGVNLSNEFHDLFRERGQRSIHEFTSVVSPPAISLDVSNLGELPNAMDSREDPIIIDTNANHNNTSQDVSTSTEIHAPVFTNSSPSDTTTATSATSPTTTASSSTTSATPTGKVRKSWYRKKEVHEYRDPPKTCLYLKRKVDSVTGRFLPNDEPPLKKIRLMEKEKAKARYSNYWSKIKAGGAQTQTSPNPSASK
jgi:hypothetical protein